MIASKVADLGGKIIIGSFFFFFVFFIIRDIVLHKQGKNGEEIERDKFKLILAIIYAIIFIGTAVYMIIGTSKENMSKQQDKYDESIYKYDSPIKEHVEGIGMRNTYKSKEFKSGIYSKDSMQLSYFEDTNSFVYILSDSPNMNEVNFSDHDYIISYFFDISKGLSEQIYKYISLCIENELPPSIIIYKNNTSLKISYDYYHDAGSKKVEYVFTKYINRELDIGDSIMIYHFNLDIEDDAKNLINLVFGNVSFTKKEFKDYNSYIIK